MPAVRDHGARPRRGRGHRWGAEGTGPPALSRARPAPRAHCAPTLRSGPSLRPPPRHRRPRLPLRQPPAEAGGQRRGSRGGGRARPGAALCLRRSLLPPLGGRCRPGRTPPARAPRASRRQASPPRAARWAARLRPDDPRGGGGGDPSPGARRPPLRAPPPPPAAPPSLAVTPPKGLPSPRAGRGPGPPRGARAASGPARGRAGNRTGTGPRSGTPSAHCARPPGHRETPGHSAGSEPRRRKDPLS